MEKFRVTLIEWEPNSAALDLNKICIFERNGALLFRIYTSNVTVTLPASKVGFIYVVQI